MLQSTTVSGPSQTSDSLFEPYRANAQTNKKMSPEALERMILALQAQIKSNQQAAETYEKVLKQPFLVVKFSDDGTFKTVSQSEVDQGLQQQIQALAAQKVIRTQQQAVQYYEQTIAALRKNNDANRIRIKNKIEYLKNLNKLLEEQRAEAQKKLGRPARTAAAQNPEPTKQPQRKRRQGLMGYKRIINAALPGHDTTNLSNVSPADCAQACDEKKWCVSFDYNKFKKSCSLSDKRAADVPGGLKTAIPMNPYDHYSRR